MSLSSSWAVKAGAFSRSSSSFSSASGGISFVGTSPAVRHAVSNIVSCQSMSRGSGVAKLRSEDSSAAFCMVVSLPYDNGSLHLDQRVLHLTCQGATRRYRQAY
mmetsp:Transcript_7698/g.15502  ORF Transcript_7698/g.15502 Transcript_7698/m.15502 type:complete len:104 (-) Transcript_7698:3-314(-)